MTLLNWAARYLAAFALLAGSLSILSRGHVGYALVGAATGILLTLSLGCDASK